MRESRIALGTAQLGQRYGIANRSGIPARAEVAAILACARDAGSDTIDTAMAYGDSESVLGEAGVQSFSIVTKLPPIVPDCADVEAWVRMKLRSSLDRLRVDRLDGLLLHRPADLAGRHAGPLKAVLESVRAEGLVRRIGVSVYEPDEIDALGSLVHLDLVQVPYSILDQRFERSGCLRRLTDAGTEIHSRSVFLQGLLLMSWPEIPAAFAAWRPVFDRYHAWLEQSRTSPLDACLGFALSNPDISRVVVGVESVAQLRQVYASARASIPAIGSELATDDMNLINPSNWMRA
ncbi:MAG: aldo/keto reductase [Pseudomonadota bacterium]